MLTSRTTFHQASPRTRTTAFDFAGVVLGDAEVRLDWVAIPLDVPEVVLDGVEVELDDVEVDT